MQLQKIRLRYYPPGIALCFRKQNENEKFQHLDLLDLNTNSNPEDVTQQIILETQKAKFKSEIVNTTANLDLTINEKNKELNPQNVDAIITEYNFFVVKEAIIELQKKLREPTQKKFYLSKTLNSYSLPLTNICFDKVGERFLIGSYDKSCKVINTTAGKEERILQGHDNVVFAVNFSFPTCDKVVTASFDGTAKIWDVSSGLCQNTFFGNKSEVVAAEFHPFQPIIVTASMDGTARIFDIELGLETQLLNYHKAEVIASKFSANGNLLLTASFDKTAIIWDIKSKSIVARLEGHTAELSNCLWNFNGSLVATNSMDKSALLWDVRNCDKSIFCITDRQHEVLDIAFDTAGKWLTTCGTDNTASIWCLQKLNLFAQFQGHCGDINKVCFSPPGKVLMTASADCTTRLWNIETEKCIQVLEHKSDVFTCMFNYNGNMIVTAAKDNTCHLWN